MDVETFLQNNVVIMDGGTGTLLQGLGLGLGELPERWNVTRPNDVIAIHKAYFDAGSNIVCTNTFGANALKFDDAQLEQVIASAVNNAKLAKEQSRSTQEKFIALDIGPLGKLLKPYGQLSFEEAVDIFAKTVRIGVKAGVDLIYIETLGDSYEAKAATLAAKENSNLPVFVSCAYGADGLLTTGANPFAMSAMLEGLGVDVIGVNCSLGPKQLQPIVEELLQVTSIPVLVKPNAGLPQTDGEKTYYNLSAEAFAQETAQFVEMGARIVGGCCGTTPAYISALAKRLQGVKPKRIEKKNISCVSSYTHAVVLDKPVVIGERINPTGKKKFKQALLDGNFDYALGEALSQKQAGAHILDVNIGLPGIDEKETLTTYVREIQAVVDLPLQIDTSSVEALESALRVYNGKPLINSVNGKQESMQAVLPLVKKYGGIVVALTLDENGIPDTWQGRVAIAEKIVREAEKYGIEKKDIVIDTLTTSVATDKNAGQTTLQALAYINKTLGLRTALGVSNISFGLPNREYINSTFYAMALQSGLTCGIINPLSLEMQKTYRSFTAISGLDENCTAYVNFATQMQESKPTLQTEEETLMGAIINGRKELAEKLCKTALQETSALEIIDTQIVPALDVVGKAYEEKKVYLPGLLAAAESAKTAFEQIRLRMQETGQSEKKKCPFVIATVKGDIHDIGKNIVKTLLENYAFDVIDLGKDVPVDSVVEMVIETRAPLVGLSALMTTTLPSMRQTVLSLREKAPWCKIVVGGAVLNEDYAKQIGADCYAKDGMQTVRYAESVYAQLCKK